MSHFYVPLKATETLGVFRWYRNRILAWNGLNFALFFAFFILFLTKIAILAKTMWWLILLSAMFALMFDSIWNEKERKWKQQVISTAENLQLVGCFFASKVKLPWNISSVKTAAFFILKNTNKKTPLLTVTFNNKESTNLDVFLHPTRSKVV